MPWISEEQKKAAKEVDLLTYLQNNEPHELVKSKYGTDEYRTKTHGSLVISNGLWRWNRGQFGGRSALDYLIKVRGVNFVDAVEMVLGTGGIGASYGSAAPSAGSSPACSSRSVGYSALPVGEADGLLSYLRDRCSESAEDTAIRRMLIERMMDSLHSLTADVLAVTQAVFHHYVLAL